MPETASTVLLEAPECHSRIRHWDPVRTGKGLFTLEFGSCRVNVKG